jgi:transposase
VSISQEALFKTALNLEDPWFIISIDFSAKEKKLDIHIDFKTGSKFTCPKCGKQGCDVHISGTPTTLLLLKLILKNGIPGQLIADGNPVIDCPKTIKKHWNGVTNYIRTRIDNGILEGTNSIIQAAKDSARGCRSTKNFIITIYLRTGKLEFDLPT